MPKRSRKAIFLCLLLIVAGIAATTYLLMTRSYRALDKIATQISLPEGASWYEWMTENDLLLAFSKDRFTSQVIKRFNVTSGISKPIEIRSHNETSIDFRAIESVSPDRKWMIGQGFNEEDEPVYYWVSLDGSVSRTFPRKGSVEGAWYPDSSRWSNASSVGTPLQITEFPTPGQGKSVHYALGHGLLMPHLLGFARDGAAVVGDIDLRTTPQDRVLLYRYNPGASQKLSMHTVELPATGIVEDARIEPGGDRILWQLQVDLNASQPVWLRRVMSFLNHPYQPKMVTLFWVCRLDGQNSQILGYIDNENVDGLRWFPSKTKFSFHTEHGSENLLWVTPLP